MRVAFLVLLYPVIDATECASDGADYSYSESITSTTRTIAVSGCPNHPTKNLNPNYAVKSDQTFTIPVSPQYSASQETSLSAVGGAVGIARDGTHIYSAFAGSYTLTGKTVHGQGRASSE